MSLSTASCEYPKSLNLQSLERPGLPRHPKMTARVYSRHDRSLHEALLQNLSGSREMPGCCHRRRLQAVLPPATMPDSVSVATLEQNPAQPQRVDSPGLNECRSPLT